MWLLHAWVGDTHVCVCFPPLFGPSNTLSSGLSDINGELLPFMQDPSTERGLNKKDPPRTDDTAGGERLSLPPARVQCGVQGHQGSALRQMEKQGKSAIQISPSGGRCGSHHAHERQKEVHTCRPQLQ